MMDLWTWRILAGVALYLLYRIHEDVAIIRRRGK